jgi:hypothetical protein
MIIGYIFGGLGNQMFQYAILRSLSIEKNVPFAISLDMFDVYKSNSYKLNDIFNLECKILTKRELESERNFFFKNPLVLKIFSKLRFNIFNYNFEFDISKYQTIKIHNKKTTFLYGYWQNEQYFNNIRNIILNDFNFILPTDKLNLNHLTKINNSNSISVHIRRGDYSKSKIHDILDINYYVKAFDLINLKYNDTLFFVFSDDLIWAKENLPNNYKYIFIDNNYNASHFDMFLMSRCKHNIIANSTFSWWSAWLNINPSKIIIAPINWYKNSKHIHPLSKDWILI